jgi:cell division protein FtsN
MNSGKKAGMKNMTVQRGGFVLGMVVGLLIGLALALGVALYITKAPVPFINKVPQRTAEQDTAEAERNRDWDPNAPLGARAGPRVSSPGLPAASGNAGVLPPGIAPARRDPAAILAGGDVPPPAAVTRPVVPPAVAVPGAVSAKPAAVTAGATATTTAAAPGADPSEYFVQAGAYTRVEDAEQQRANLALMGLESRVLDREQSGRTVYRVRLGPYPKREEADAQQQRLQQAQVDAQIVRVAKP